MKCKCNENVILYKIYENEKSQEALLGSVSKMLTENVDESITLADIDFLYRIGKKGNEPRPVLIGFTTLLKKEKVMKNKRKLGVLNIGISDDLPLSLREKRKSLTPIVKSLYEKGFKVYIKFDKLIVNGEHCTEQKAKQILSNTSVNSKRIASPLAAGTSSKKHHPSLNVNIQTSNQLSSSKSPKTPTIKNYMLPSTTSIVKSTTPSKNIQIVDIVSN